MKFLMIVAALMVISGFVLGDAILGILGTVSLACGATDQLFSRIHQRVLPAF